MNADRQVVDVGDESDRMTDDRLPIDQIKAFRQGTSYFVKTVQHAIDLMHSVPEADRDPARWHHAEKLLFKAVDSGTPADAAAARAAFVAALAEEGWLRGE